jgi:hypothetical protein
MKKRRPSYRPDLCTLCGMPLYPGGRHIVAFWDYCHYCYKHFPRTSQALSDWIEGDQTWEALGGWCLMPGGTYITEGGRLVPSHRLLDD